MYRKVEKCRICGNTRLERVLDLGEQVLTGVFPANRDERVTSGPLRLVKCLGEECCGLLQLEHSYDSSEMYGDNYGYRSGLNRSMVEHLFAKARRIMQRVPLQAGDLVLDIGSNDSTGLRAYPADGPLLVGFDPTGVKFREHYPPHVRLVADFFSAGLFRQHFPGRKARVVTSYSMFYDLESPADFMREVHEVLADDGVWVFEQSYMPAMLETNGYDTVCHEHLEFYALRQIKWLADRVGFRIVDLEFNDVNGGSFSVTVAKQSADAGESPLVAEVLERERQAGFDTLAPFQAFAERAARSRHELRDFVADARARGKRVVALGASTKGNVLLQYCGFTADDIACVGEVNEQKFGCFTPGTGIPIIPEDAMLATKPDYVIVLPWHFRSFFEKSAKLAGFDLVFPLPVLTHVAAGARGG